MKKLEFITFMAAAYVFEPTSIVKRKNAYHWDTIVIIIKWQPIVFDVAIFWKCSINDIYAIPTQLKKRSMKCTQYQKMNARRGCKSFTVFAFFAQFVCILLLLRQNFATHQWNQLRIDTWNRAKRAMRERVSESDSPCQPQFVVYTFILLVSNSIFFQ